MRVVSALRRPCEAARARGAGRSGLGGSHPDRRRRCSILAAMTPLGPLEGVALLGAARHLPGPPVDNTEALRLLPGHRDATPERLAFAAAGVERPLGLRARHWVHRPGDALAPWAEASTADLAVAAARAALTDAGLRARDLGLLLATTSTPHRMTSTLSAAVGAVLGTTAPAMDVRTGCAAGLFALQTAATYLQHAAGPVLLVAAETFSKVLPPDHKMALLSLGDGAAALVLGRRDGARLHALALKTDGRLGGLITTDGALPPTESERVRGGYRLSGAPEALAEVLPEKYAEAIDAVLPASSVAPALFVPHQTSRPLIERVAEDAGVPEERTWTAGVGDHANIGSAGWVAALAAARAAGRAAAGTELLVAAVGGGMSWGAARWRC
ncbi:MAG: hypothetical protein CMN29_23050 [Sandaracinus sp.]|nr:hypothetical protein [Sandaracinus sp.]